MSLSQQWKRSTSTSRSYLAGSMIFTEGESGNEEGDNNTGSQFVFTLPLEPK